MWASGDNGSGIFRSADAGQTWARFTNAPQDHATHALTLDAANPSRTYAPNYSGRGMLRTMDGGTTWDVTGSGLRGTVGSAVYDMAVDPTSPTTIYACTASGLLQSIDSGATFAQLRSRTFVSEFDFRAVAVSNHGVFVGTAEGRVHHSTDSGASWSEITTTTGDAISDLALSTSTLYIAEVDATILRTNAANPSFVETLNQGGGFGFITSGRWTKLTVASGASANSDLLCVGTVSTPSSGQWGFFVSFDGGRIFERRTNGIPRASVFSIAIDPFNPRRMIVGTIGDGIYRSVDAGLNWTAANTGVVATNSIGFAEDPTDSQHLLVSSTDEFNGTPGVFESNDGGANWSPVFGFPNDAAALDIDPVNPRIWLAGGFNGNNNFNPGVQRSTTGANGPWTPALPTSLQIDRFERTDSTVFALATAFSAPATAADVGLYASTDSGATWAKRFTGAVQDLAVHPSETDHIVVVGVNACASTNAFATSSPTLGLASFAPLSRFTSVEFVSPTHLLVGGARSELFETRNYNPSGAGVTWARVTTPAVAVLVSDIHVVNGYWYIVCSLNPSLSTLDATPGILRSTDEGANWTFIDSDASASRLTRRLHRARGSNSRFYAGMAGGGLLRLDDVR